MEHGGGAWFTNKDWSSVSVYGFGGCTHATEQSLLEFPGMLNFLEPFAPAVLWVQRGGLRSRRLFSDRLLPLPRRSTLLCSERLGLSVRLCLLLCRAFV